MKPGKVWLVGAGPGDPELLTLKAMRVLGEADVVLHDDLVQAETLRFAKPDARIVAVGKRGGCASTPQAFIERLLVAEAAAGHVVVRLKGGDPLVFGRGGEECEALRAAKIPFEVVNGITAGVAAPAAIGVPLTHRVACHGFIMVTGQAAGNGPDWMALARAASSGMTLVIYMGVAQLDALCAALMAGGLDAAMPAAIVERATQPGQRALVTVLSELWAEQRFQQIGSPSIIVIGEVVRHASPKLLASHIPCSPQELDHQATGAYG